jgi:hypothetical protein
VTKVPSIPARIDELIAVAQGLQLELEATRKQVAFVGAIAEDLLKSTQALKARLTHKEI